MALLIWHYPSHLRTLTLHHFGHVCSFRYEDMMYYVVLHRTKSGGGVFKYCCNMRIPYQVAASASIVAVYQHVTIST